MEAYKVWVTLNLKGDAQKKMEQFLALVKKTTAEVNKLTRSLANFEKHFKNISGVLGSVNPEIRIFNTNISQSISVMNSASISANRLSMSINNIHRATARSGRAGAGIGSNRFLMGAAAGFGLYNPAMMAGAGVAYAGIHGFNQTTEYQKSIMQLQAQGFTDAQIAEVDSIAKKTRRGISPVTMIQAIVDAQMATRDFSQAKILAPTLAQGRMSAQAIYGGMTHEQQQSLIRAAEIPSGGNTQKMAQWLSVAMQMMATSGGTIKPNEQRTFWRQAAGSMSRLTPLGYLSLEPMLQEYGGAKTGTALTTGLRAFINPQMAHFARYQTGRLQSLGMWDSKTNRMKKEYIEMIQTDPSQFAKAWMGNLSKKGITNPGDVLAETMADFPRTFGTLVSMMIKNMGLIERSRALAAQSMGGDALYKLSQTNQSGAVLRLSQAFDSFSQSLNDLASPATIKVLNMISTFFETWASVFSTMKSGTLNPFAAKAESGSFFSRAFGGDVTAPSAKSANQPMGGHVYLDGEKVGKVVFNRAGNWMQTYVQHGVSGLNTVGSPIYPGTNNLGVQGI